MDVYIMLNLFCFNKLRVIHERSILIVIIISALLRLHACSSLISQDERMSESPVETLEKALGLHFISKMA